MKKQKTKNVAMRQEMVDPASLKAHPMNASLFGRSNNYDRLLESMRKEGFRSQYPITCNEKNTIIMGHTRGQAAIELGIKEVPVIRISSTLPEDEVLRLMIEDNLCRPAEWRQLSPLDKYVLATRLEETRPEYRGGNQKNISGRKTEIPKDGWLAKQVGLCPKYISNLRVSIEGICEGISKTHPEVKGLKPYEQIAFILKNDLSQDLADLQTGALKIGALYKKYKKAKEVGNTYSKPRREKEEHAGTSEKKDDYSCWLMKTLSHFRKEPPTLERIKISVDLLTSEDIDSLRSLSRFIQGIFDLKKEQDRISAMKDINQMSIPGLEG